MTLRDHLEYSSYKNAKARCNNPKHDKYAYYGGRGILFKFTSFEDWFSELGPRPSPDHQQDRIDTNGHYEKGNMKWSTRSEQMLNRRPYVQKAHLRPDLTGEIFLRLTARWPEGTKGRNTVWLCSCECGKLVRVSAGNLQNGHTRSCGCGKRGRRCL